MKLSDVKIAQIDLVSPFLRERERLNELNRQARAFNPEQMNLATDVLERDEQLAINLVDQVDAYGYNNRVSLGRVEKGIGDADDMAIYRRFKKMQRSVSAVARQSQTAAQNYENLIGKAGSAEFVEAGFTVQGLEDKFNVDWNEQQSNIFFDEDGDVMYRITGDDGSDQSILLTDTDAFKFDERLITKPVPAYQRFEAGLPVTTSRTALKNNIDKSLRETANGQAAISQLLRQREYDLNPGIYKTIDDVLDSTVQAQLEVMQAERLDLNTNEAYKDFVEYVYGRNKSTKFRRPQGGGGDNIVQTPNALQIFDIGEYSTGTELKYPMSGETSLGAFRFGVDGVANNLEATYEPYVIGDVMSLGKANSKSFKFIDARTSQPISLAVIKQTVKDVELEFGGQDITIPEGTILDEAMYKAIAESGQALGFITDATLYTYKVGNKTKNKVLSQEQYDQLIDMTVATDLSAQDVLGWFGDQSKKGFEEYKKEYMVPTQRTLGPLAESEPAIQFSQDFTKLGTTGITSGSPLLK